MTATAARRQALCKVWHASRSRPAASGRSWRFFAWVAAQAQHSPGCNAQGACDEEQGVKHIEDHQVADIGHDPLLLESFYREHSQTVRAFLTRRVSTAEDTADLMADVFMAAIDTAHRYRQRDGTAAAWLLGIARNKVADFQRRTARRLRAEHKLLGHRLLDEDATARLEERIEAERLTRALYDALANLPARDRRLMELVAVDGVSIADAAALLGIQPGTARVRLHRSRARLRNHLGDQSVLESIGQDPTVLPAQEVTA